MVARDVAAPGFEPRVVLVGCGRIAFQYHLPYLRRLGVPIAAAVDPDREARRRFEQIVPGARCVPEIDDLGDAGTCALVCSPTALHFEHASALLARGLHVLCEKPLGRNRSEATALVRSAAARRRVLQAGYVRRFHRASRRVAELIRSGVYGAPVACFSAGGHIVSPSEAPDWLFDPDASAGGVTMDVGVHFVDRLASWVDGLELREYRDDCVGGVEANAVLQMQGRVGVSFFPIMVVLSRTCSWGYWTLVELESAWIKLNLNEGHHLTIVPKHGSAPSPERAAPGLPRSERWPVMDSFGAQWEEFCSTMAGAAPEVSSLGGAIVTSSITEDCYVNRLSLLEHAPATLMV